MVGHEAVTWRISPLKLRMRVAFTVCAVALGNGMAKTHAQQSGVDSPMPLTLDSLRDRYRPVLVFAPSTTPALVQQMHILAAGAYGLHDRNVITVPLLFHDDGKPWGVTFNLTGMGQMPPDEQAAARRRFHIRPNDFTVILIGKDGGEKLRSHQPLSLDTLRSTIDAMPMRQDEMRTHPKQ
jgi:hypothetical protein